MAVIVVGGMFLLSRVGDSFISEVVQQSPIEEIQENIEESPVPVFGVSGANKEVNKSMGKPAPYFKLSDLKSASIQSTDFLGTPIIVTFWTTWNLASADQIKIFHEYITERKEELFTIITISSQEDKSAVSSFINRGAYTVDVLLDEVGEATEAYKARNLPTTYFIDKNGIVLDIFVGILSKAMLIEKAEKILGD